MKALLINDTDNFRAFLDKNSLSDWMPFNDNGDLPDGNAFLIELDELKWAPVQELTKLGEIVDVESADYRRNEDEEWPSFDGKWMGMQISNHALIVI